MERASDMEMRRSACLLRKLRPTALRLLCNLYRRICSNFPLAHPPPLDQEWVPTVEAWPLLLMDPQDMALRDMAPLMGLQVMARPTGTQTMVAHLKDLPADFNLYHHLPLACRLVLRAELLLTSTHPQPVSAVRPHTVLLDSTLDSMLHPDLDLQDSHHKDDPLPRSMRENYENKLHRAPGDGSVRAC